MGCIRRQGFVINTRRRLGNAEGEAVAGIADEHLRRAKEFV